MKDTRNIILHYHLFKNAGTSIDAILKEHFEDKWITREFRDLEDNSAEVKEWIISNPDAIVFSSHTMNGTIPQIDGVNITSITMLRNPIKRIISAYKFERMQKSNTWGAEIAKSLSFEDYVVARLQKQGDSQCRNFQTERLATLSPGPEAKINRALASLEKLSVVGIVEDFNKSLDLMETEVKRYFPDFNCEAAHSNRSRLFDFEMGPALDQLLFECNRMDHRLWRIAHQSLKNRKAVVPSI